MAGLIFELHGPREAAASGISAFRGPADCLPCKSAPFSNANIDTKWQHGVRSQVSLSRSPRIPSRASLPPGGSLLACPRALHDLRAT